MPNHLSHLVETIVWSFPVQDPHLEKRQKQRIIDLHTVHHLEPFSPSDLVPPQPIIEEEVWEDIIPPMMVCSHRILPFLDDSVEGILGDLRESPSVFLQAETKRETTS